MMSMDSGGAENTVSIVPRNIRFLKLLLLPTDPRDGNFLPFEDPFRETINGSGGKLYMYPGTSINFFVP